MGSPVPLPQLRKSSRIKTIWSTVAIEGNDLLEQQAQTLLEGKNVGGPKKDILEIKNAFDCYAKAATLQPSSEKDFLKTHKTMMNGLVDRAGIYRSSNVGVIGQVGVRHVAPKPQLLPKLMSELFLFIKSNSDYTPLVLSSIIHYEIEFIHPFQDGNGRMGRFWQHLMLIKYHPAFEFVPVESIIHTSQQNYYDALQASDKEGQATQFVVYALAAIHAALKEFTSSVKRTKITVSDRLNSAKEKLNGQWFDRKKYIEVIGGISTATASRDLKAGLESKQLKSRGEHRKTEYCFV